jgi:hypothetical protein
MIGACVNLLWDDRLMKTTLEIPDSVLRSAKARAAEKGISLRQFVTEAVKEKLKTSTCDAKPWMQVVGELRHLKKETARINRTIEEEFEKIDPADWQ